MYRHSAEFLSVLLSVWAAVLVHGVRNSFKVSEDPQLVHVWNSFWRFAAARIDELGESYA
jgi:hypothetical protein